MYDLYIQKGNIEVWTKRLAATFQYATAIFNQGNDGVPANVTIPIKDLGTNYDTGTMNIHDVWNKKEYPNMSYFYDALSIMVDPNGVALLHIFPVV